MKGIRERLDAREKRDVAEEDDFAQVQHNLKTILQKLDALGNGNATWGRPDRTSEKQLSPSPRVTPGPNGSRSQPAPDHSTGSPKPALNRAIDSR
jgi:hypothetical protein